MRRAKLLVVLGLLMLVASAQAHQVRPGTIDGLADKIKIRSHCYQQAQASVARDLAPATFRVFQVYFEGHHGNFPRQIHAYIDLADSNGSMARVPVALGDDNGIPFYTFTCAERITRWSRFHFSGPNGDYEMDLMYWDEIGSPFVAQFGLRRSAIGQGEVAIVDVVLSSTQDVTLTFGGCIMLYRLINSNHEVVATGPFSECTGEVTHVDLVRDIPQSFQMEIPSGPTVIGGMMREEALVPGLYYVECFVVGYEDLGLAAMLELTILKQ